MAKRVMRTEAQEQRPGIAIGDHVWFFQRENGHSYEHLARVDAVHDDGTADLSWLVRGELSRTKATKIPAVNSNFTGSSWAKA